MFDEKDVSEENREKLWNYYNKKLSKGIDIGFGDSIEFDDSEIVKALKKDIAKFSAFKETSFKNDLEKLLVQDDRLIPWSEYKKEAYKLSGDYNGTWLETEYHHTIANANMAQKWKEFERDVDLYPNLKLTSVNDGRVRPEHKVLDGTIRPFNDPFWDTHTPPLDWGCRCDIEQTDEDPTDIPGGFQTKIEFENNPGKTGTIFGGSAYEERLTVSEVKEAEKNAKKWSKKVNMNVGKGKEATPIFDLPRNNQFEELHKTKTGKLLQHYNITKGDDYDELLEIGKLLAETEKRVEMMPEIYKDEKKIRDIIFPNLLSDTSNPDYKIGKNYFDLKRPEAIKNIVGNANKASKQGAIAIISDSRLDRELTEKILNERVKDIFKNKNYLFDKVYFYKNKKLIIFNRTGD